LGKKALTQELYDAVVAAYRADNVTEMGGPAGLTEDERASRRACRVAKSLKIDARTVKKLFAAGYKAKGWIAVQTVLDTDRVKARALAQLAVEERRKQTEAERAAANRNAAEARATEAQIVGLARGTAALSIQEGLRLKNTVSKLALQVSKAIENRVAGLEMDGTLLVVRDGKGQPVLDTNGQPIPVPPVSVEKGLSILKDVADLELKLLQFARGAFELERVYLGKPTNTFGVELTDTRDMGKDEIEARWSTLVGVLKNAVARGALSKSSPLVTIPAEGEVVTDASQV
jgi:hypothetical protein